MNNLTRFSPLIGSVSFFYGENYVHHSLFSTPRPTGLCLILTLFNIQRFRVKCATDLHHTKKLRTPHKKCRVFRYPTLIFVVIFVPLPEFMSLVSYTPLILCRWFRVPGHFSAVFFVSLDFQRKIFAGYHKIFATVRKNIPKLRKKFRTYYIYD